ncbi:MAG: hypothetical protein IKH63_14880 [Prevotella sp.]|nr:hypothetical protein [Prevotella sp.]
MPHFSSSGKPNSPSPLRLIGVCHFKASLLSKNPERAKRKRQRLAAKVGDVVALFD